MAVRELWLPSATAVAVQSCKDSSCTTVQHFPSTVDQEKLNVTVCGRRFKLCYIASGSECVLAAGMGCASCQLLRYEQLLLQIAIYLGQTALALQWQFVPVLVLSSSAVAHTCLPTSFMGQQPNYSICLPAPPWWLA
jgi:hypothetical protein